MADIVYIAVIIAFFALAAAFVHACDRIIGPDETSTALSAGPPDETAAPSDGSGDGREPVRAGAQS